MRAYREGIGLKRPPPFPPVLPLVLLFGAALLLYLSFQSISLDDFDSVSFALALDHFDISLQQPHPPGFPVYIAAGRAVRLVVADSRAALTLLSALTGSLAAAVLAWLAAELDDLPAAGFLPGLWLMVLPGFWLSSEMALSDVPGVALVVLAIGALWKGRRDWRWLAAGAFLTGLCLGSRPQNALPAALFGAYSLVRLVRIPGQRAMIGVVLVVGAGSILLWLMPTLGASGGWNSYWSLVRQHSIHVLQVDALLGRPITGPAITARIESFGQGLVALVGGEPWLAMFTVVVLIIGLARVRWRSTAAVLCTVWLLLSITQVFLLESLERPRLYLPFVPPLALLASFGWGRIWRDRHRLQIVTRFVPLLLAGAFAAVGFPMAVTLTREPSPPVQATTYIAAHYPADRTLIVSLGSLRAAQVGLPAYPQLYLGQFDAAAWKETMAVRQPANLVLLDRDDIWPDAYAALTEGGSYVPIEDRIFSRDPRVFPQHSLVRVQVLMPIRLLSPSQLALPSSGEIRVGDTADGKYIGEGWYRAEEIAGTLARWSQQTAVIRAALPPADTILTIEAAPYSSDQRVTVLVNDQVIGTLQLRDTWQAESLTIPASAIAGHPISMITFRHARAEVPPGSDRVLAAAYRVIRFQRRS